MVYIILVQHDLEYTETKTQETRQTSYKQAHIPQILSEKIKAELNSFKVSHKVRGPRCHTGFHKRLKVK